MFHPYHAARKDKKPSFSAKAFSVKHALKPGTGAFSKACIFKERVASFADRPGRRDSSPALH
jgi:hypothetical protein